MEKALKKASDLTYLTDTMDGNKKLIREIMDVFLKQAPEEISFLNKAIDSEDYRSIKHAMQRMKASASIMGISSLSTILNKIQELATSESGMAEILQLKTEAVFILNKAIDEISSERRMYV